MKNTFTLIVFISLLCCGNVLKSETPDFSKAAEGHLNSIVNRDFSSFAKTIHPDFQYCILPNGIKVAGYREFLEMNKKWFKDNDWTFDYKVVNRFHKKEFGSILLHVRYSDVNREGEPIKKQFYLSLTFVPHQGQWKLLLDQNTDIPQN